VNRRDTRTLSADRTADTAGTPRGVFMLVCPASSAPPGFHTFGKYLVDGSFARSHVEAGVELANGDVASGCEPPRERTVANVGLRWQFQPVNATHRRLRRQLECCIDRLKPPPLSSLCFCHPGARETTQNRATVGLGLAENEPDPGLSCWGNSTPIC